MVEQVLEKLCTLFDEGKARYRVMHHPAGERSSASVAELRGTELGQGAKALVCMVKGNGVKQYVLAVLPADCQADLVKIAHAFGGTRCGLCSASEVMDLTGCIFGAVPPVSFTRSFLTSQTPRFLRAMRNSPLTRARATPQSSSIPKTFTASCTRRKSIF